MKIRELEALGFKALQAYEDGEITAAYCGDLLSDVVAHAPADSVLITIQGHKNTLAVATLVGISAIILVNQAKAEPDMLEAARTEGVAVFSTPLNQYQTALKLSLHIKG